jgi:succinate-semialdehyde dehydrogenase/glutarate-semialdehyde dehydrogenase
MVEHFRRQVVGDPLAEETTVGPLARLDLRATLAAQVERSMEAGARCVVGGSGPVPGVPEGGAYFQPTILDGVAPGMPAFEEELFGPVAAVCKVGSDGEAVELANRSSFGLGAAVFSRDEDRARRMAVEQLEAGCVVVNGFVTSDPRLPFGGIKDSGFGRELSEFGIREFVNVKTISG